MHPINELIFDTGVWASHADLPYTVQAIAGPLGARTVTVYIVDREGPMYEDVVSYMAPSTLEDLQRVAREAFEAYVREAAETD